MQDSVARGEGYGEFSDDPEDEAAAATVLRDDDLGFFDQGDRSSRQANGNRYSDDEQDVFSHGDGDEEDPLRSK